MPRGERPLEPGDGVVVKFARHLRLLREKAGSPTYRELGARAHYSAAALSEAASGRKLPSLPVTIAYVAACGGDTAEWEARWRETAAELAAATADAPDEDDGGRPPYVGLAAFEPEDAERFFGRYELVADLVRRLRDRRLLGVFGASGCGKSSLLRAGLAAHLAVEREHDPAPIVVFTPGRHPIEECAVQLAWFVQESPGALRDELSAGSRNLHLRIRQAVVDSAAEFDVVLVVDQFEELFTLCGDARERATFVDALVTAATDPASRTRVVLGIRADFLGHCGEHPRLVTALRDAQVLVGAMTTDELRRAITGPAEQAGYRVETALVTRLVADAARQPGMLPLVSHALLRTWLRRRGKVMTLAGYDAVGGIEHAIARSAEEVYQALDTNQHGVARQIFLRLTAPGEGTEDTKRRVTRDELGQEDPNVAEVVDKLARARLITLGRDSVEIAHEALIRHWPRLRDWLADDRDGHRIRRQLTEATIEWEHHDRDDGLLYRGARLAAWQDRPLDQLNSRERAFLDTSRRAAEREHRARRRRAWWTISGLSSTTVIAVVLAVVAMMMATRADNERKLAVSRQLIADARAQLQTDPELGLLLAREAYTRTPNKDTESVLRQAAVDSHIRATLPAYDADGLAVMDAVFSSDGQHLVVADAGGTLQVWDWDARRGIRTKPRVLRGESPLRRPVFSPDSDDIAATSSRGVHVIRDWASGGKAVPLAGQHSEVSSVAFSSDGRLLASGGWDGTVRVWDLAGGGSPVVLGNHDKSALEVAFSPDGRRLTSGGEDGTVRVWDLVAGGRPVVLDVHAGVGSGMAFSTSGPVASADADGTIRVWDPVNRTGGTGLGVHAGGVHALAYSADGQWIASGGNDGTVRIWNADQIAEPVVLRQHRGAVNDVEFSPDGRTVVSTSDDGTAKVWDVNEVADVTVLRGHGEPILNAVASRDGRRVASGAQDGTVRLWDTSGDGAPIMFSTTGEPVLQVAFSPNGRFLAALHEDRTVLVWDTDDPTEPTQLGLPGRVFFAGVAFSPDSERLVVLADYYLWIWNIAHANAVGQPTVEQLPGDFGVLSAAVWSTDGRHLAAGSIDGSVLVWDLQTRTEPLVLRGHRAAITSLAFSSSGSHLASAGDDGTIRLWNLARAANPVVLRGQQDVISHLTYSSDGRYLITNGSDAAINIWRTDGPSEPLVLDGFSVSVRTVMAVADDRYVTTHDDGSVRVWRCSVCGPVSQVLDYASKRLTRDLTSQERHTFLPADP